MKIGRHFTLEELTFSQTAVRRGIPNQANPQQIAALQALVLHILDPLRDHLGCSIQISSGLRVPALNKAIGGVPTSQHCFGEAADILVPGHSIASVVAEIRHLNLPFDQLIDEFGQWTHVSYGPRHRGQVLIARKVNGHTVYSPGA
jgi:uncharacterized protein YcbK (DUF882 family)